MAQSFLKEYIEKTGEDLQELLSGAAQFGPTFLDKLAKQALDEGKKIVFIPELINGENLGTGRYELQPL